MKDKLRSISNLPFLACLGLLLLNDFYLKTEYHNWLTGKLSDVCGLYVFASFWTAIFPEKKRAVYLTTAFLFAIWKSPYSQGFIDFFSENLYTIARMVDFSDLVALLVLPLGFFYVPSHSARIRLNPVPIAFLTVISFCATSIPQPTQVFTQPQYLLFKPGIVKLEDTDHPSNYQVYDMDSLLVIRVKEIEIDKRAEIDDEYHKAQILKDLDLRLLKAAKEPYGRATEPHDYINLRDSLIVGERTSVDLPLDSVTEHLRFSGTRLHGRFARLSKTGKLVIDGRFNNGIEDSVWSFYDAGNELVLRKYFENGELIKTESYEDANRVSVQKHRTRDDIIRNKYFYLATIALLIIGLVIRLALNYKQSDRETVIRVSSLNKIAGTIGLPIVVFTVAKLISSLIPDSFEAFFLAGFGEAIMVYVVTVPLFMLIFYFFKLRGRFDIVFYILLFSLGVVFVEEWLYLRNILY
jgi:hypothetical protein